MRQSRSERHSTQNLRHPLANVTALSHAPRTCLETVKHAFRDQRRSVHVRNCVWLTMLLLLEVGLDAIAVAFEQSSKKLVAEMPSRFHALVAKVVSVVGRATTELRRQNLDRQIRDEKLFLRRGRGEAQMWKKFVENDLLRISHALRIAQRVEARRPDVLERFLLI